jgi:hypothetical protein
MVVYSTETSSDSYRTTWRYTPESITLRSHRCKNLNPNKVTKCMHSVTILARQFSFVYLHHRKDPKKDHRANDVFHFPFQLLFHIWPIVSPILVDTEIPIRHYKFGNYINGFRPVTCRDKCSETNRGIFLFHCDLAKNYFSLYEYSMRCKRHYITSFEYRSINAWRTNRKIWWPQIPGN